LAAAGREASIHRIIADWESRHSAAWMRAWGAPSELTEDPPRQFVDGVGRILDYLAAGDVFQVNLSRGWQARFDAPLDPAALHARLRAANPAPFAGLFAGNGWAVVSASPERLVSVRGDVVETRPIAGTRPRFAGDDDTARIRDLVGNPKERAEHVMLIDLERNDLGRVCVPGSIEVDELMSVESYAHVHHIVSNVRGRLREDATPGLVPRAEVDAGGIRRGRGAQGALEVPAVEQPLPPDPAAGQPAVAGEGLDALDVEVEVAGDLVGAQQVHRGSLGASK
jgi:anthranilate synthase component 1